jgi:prepilin-type N-terminal cleavage/methylation domain-containing protein
MLKEERHGMKINNCQKGFTLIEVIAVLVLVGLLSLAAATGFVTAVQGYLFAKNNATISEKAQLAINRIYQELVSCDSCTGTSGSVGTITNYISSNRTITLSGSNIVLSEGANTDILLDNVNTFTMIYNANGSITVTISLLPAKLGNKDVPVPNFVTIVYPRNYSS